MQPENFIYVIETKDRYDNILDIAKIGYSNDPHTRLGQLITGCPYKARIRATFAFADEKTARWAERTAKDDHRSHRMNGEWFSLSGEQIQDHLTTWLGSPHFQVQN